VRYFGASTAARLMRASCSAWLSTGGGAVRLSTGSPMARKKRSCPAGVHMHSMWACLPETFLKKCGAFAGMFTVVPMHGVAVAPAWHLARTRLVRFALLFARRSEEPAIERGQLLLQTNDFDFVLLGLLVGVQPPAHAPLHTRSSKGSSVRKTSKSSPLQVITSAPMARAVNAISASKWRSRSFLAS
jgi:hypothetical protein